MTKNKAIKIMKELIDDEIEAIEKYNEAIKSFAEYSEVVDMLGYLHRDEVNHLAQLNSAKKRMEMTEQEIESYNISRDMRCGCCGESPIIFDEGE